MRTSWARRTAAVGAIGVAFALAEPVIASAADTKPIYGRDNCQAVADQYRAMGYSARCYLIHDDTYYVNYTERTPGLSPGISSGSAGR